MSVVSSYIPSSSQARALRPAPHPVATSTLEARAELDRFAPRSPSPAAAEQTSTRPQVHTGPTRDLPPPRPPEAVGPEAFSQHGLRTLAGPNGTLYQEPEEKLDDETYECESLFPDEVFHLNGLPRPDDLPADLRHHWTRRFGMPVREFYRTLFDTARVKPGESRLSVERDAQGEIRAVDLEFDLECPRTGRRIGTMDRGLTFPEHGAASAYHRLFDLDRQCQGRGIAKDLLANSVKLYDKAGVTKIKLAAALSVGGYAWAKYGFKPNPGRETRELFKTVRERLDRLGDAVPQSVRRLLTSLLCKDDPKAIWAISDLEGVRVPRGDKEIPLGKALLLGTAWKGSLELDDNQARTRFNQYIHRSQESK